MMDKEAIELLSFVPVRAFFERIESRGIPLGSIL